jgi:hypothetical protein
MDVSIKTIDRLCNFVGGCRLWVVGYRLWVVGCLLSVVSCRLGVVGCGLWVVGLPPSPLKGELERVVNTIMVVTTGCRAALRFARNDGWV